MQKFGENFEEKHAHTQRGYTLDQRVCTRNVQWVHARLNDLSGGSKAGGLHLHDAAVPKLQVATGSATSLSCTTLPFSGLRLKGPPGVTTSQVSCQSKLYTCSNCYVTNLVYAVTRDIHSTISYQIMIGDMMQKYNTI